MSAAGKRRYDEGVMSPTPEDLITFLRGLGDDLLLPALWLVRRSDLGAVLEEFYEPEERMLELVEKRLFRQDRQLYEFVLGRRTEN